MSCLSLVLATFDTFIDNLSYSHCLLDMILTVTFWRVGLLLPFQEVRPQPAAVASEPAVVHKLNIWPLNYETSF